MSFSALFSATSVDHIMTEESDHLALLMKVRATFTNLVQRGPQGFRFEEMWTRHEGYNPMVEQAWADEDEDVHRLQGMWHRLRNVTRSMQEWSNTVSAQYRRKLKG